MKVNVQFKFGSFAVEPSRGYIVLKMNPTIDTEIFNDRNTLELTLKLTKITAQSSLQHHMVRILYLLNYYSPPPFAKLFAEDAQLK